MTITTRFAPSPTGELHLGHAASALFAYQTAQEAGGKFILRIEDIDPIRCKPEFTDPIYEDLHWLGLSWEEPVLCQSAHMGRYAKALNFLRQEGLLYPCFCTRKEVLAEAAQADHAPHEATEGPLYSGTCRNLTGPQRAALSETRDPVWRLDMALACTRAGDLRWYDHQQGEVKANPARFGDVVLARKDVAASYHLCVTLDDAYQEVNLVTRGIDLMPFTDIHVLLQKLLDLPQPDYHHHRLLYDKDGKRFAKRDKAMTLRHLRENGRSPEDIKAYVRKHV